MIVYFFQSMGRVVRPAAKVETPSCIRYWGAMLLFWLSPLALAQPVPPLEKAGMEVAAQELATALRTDAQEIKALLQEFEAMRRTDERRVTEFVTTVATPERLNRLYRTPEIARLEKSLRENGLIFAGQTGATLLAFDKPSDVIAKVSAWFPDELAAARVQKRLSRSDIRLWGPYSNWALEPATFMAMWNCMPTEAWLQPQSNPFQNALGSAKFMLMAGRGSNDSDFGECVRARSGFGGATTNEEAEKIVRQRRTMNEGVVPNLRKKFAHFLQTNRCRGTGPDDCVLVLHLWASLAAEDPELAAMVKSLEPDIALGAPLPAMKMPYDPSNPKFEAGTDRFDEVWKRAAFLRAKLRSILAAQNAWPDDSLRQAIAQVVALQSPLQEPYAVRFDYADIDYRAPAISPWWVLYNELGERDKAPDGIPPAILPWVYWPRDPATVHRVRTVVLEALNRMDENADCATFKPWLTPEIKVEFSFGRLERSSAGAKECVQTDWAWLKAGASEEAVKLRDRYLRFVPTATPQIRDLVLQQLTDNGNACFGENKSTLPDWQKRLCHTWIHEPETVGLSLVNTKLALDKKRSFAQFTSYPPNDANNQPMADQQAWLTSLAQGLPAATASLLGAYAKELKGKGTVVQSATLWRHAGHSRALLELGLAGGDCGRIFMLLAPHGLQQIHIPQRIWSDSLCHSEIVRVSDVDQDGNLELWWALEDWGAAKFDKCVGDDSDLARNLDCSAIHQATNMAEVAGSALTYFVNDLPSQPKPPADERWASSGNAYPLPTAPAVQSAGESACNRMRIGSVLSEELEIEEWSEDASGGRQVIDMVCARHPVNSDQTIVALFYEPTASDVAQNERSVGFAVAVIDIQRKQVLRRYRSLVEEDATTRIRGSSGSLRVDTARYSLAPKVRAFGVRMNTQYSPHYAEGGSGDYLTLFVEEGKTLRPVLRDLAMRSWTMLDSSGCFDSPEGSNLPCVIENQTNTIAVAPTSTRGWRDLDLITTTTLGDESKPSQRAIQKLRYGQNKYE